MQESSGRVSALGAAIVLLTAGIFITDLLTPLGWTIWVLYIIPFVFTFQLPWRWAPVAFSLLFTALTGLGFLYSPDGIASSTALFNRILGVGVMWAFVLAMASREKARTEMAVVVAGREQAERERLHNYLRLEGILESAMDAIITVDKEQRVLLFNKAAAQMFQYPGSEAVGQSIDRFIPPRFRQAHREHVRSFGQSRVTNRRMGKLGTIVGLRADGTEFPIEASISQIEADGHKLYTVILRDITERLRAEEQFRLVVESSPSGMLMVDREGIIVMVNSRIEHQFGYTGEELLGKPVEILIPERYQQQHVKQRETFVQAPQARPMGAGRDLFGRRKNGSEFPVEIGLTPVQAMEGMRILASIVDITQRKEAEERETRLGRILENSLNEIYVFDAETLRFIEVNRGARENLGYRMEELRELTPLDLKPEFTAESFEELLQPVRSRERHEAKFRTFHRRKDGSMYPVNVHLQLSTVGARQAFVAIILDITEMKQAEEQLRRTERLAEIGTLASGMAHEIGTPMNVILGRAEYVMRRTQEDATRKGLEIIIAQVERITKIMNQLLAFARRRPIERRPMDLRQTITDTLEVVHERLETHGIKVESSFAEPIPSISADADQMSQVLLNLLVNAIHAMPEGGILRIDLQPTNGSVRMTIADTGRGIPKENLPKIFAPFFTTKEVGKGTGLGLTVVHGIIQEHGGSISVESEPGQGTTFTIYLPISQEPEQPQAL